MLRDCFSSPVGLWYCLSIGGTSNICSLLIHWVDGLVSEIFYKDQGDSSESWRSSNFFHPSLFRGVDLRHLLNFNGHQIKRESWKHHGRRNYMHGMSLLEKKLPRNFEWIQSLCVPEGKWQKGDQSRRRDESSPPSFPAFPSGVSTFPSSLLLHYENPFMPLGLPLVSPRLPTSKQS